MRLFSIIILGMLLLSTQAFGQDSESIESLEQQLKTVSPGSEEKVDLLNKLGYGYWIIDSNKSISLGEEALALARELNYEAGIAFAQRVIGVSYWTQGKPKQALENLQACQEAYDKIGDPEGAANCLMNSGMVYADIGDLDRALEIYEASVDRFTALNLKSRIATTFNKIGVVFLQKEEFSKAREYLINGLNMHSDQGYAYGMAEAHNFLGRLFILEDELEQANYHLEKALELGEEVNDIDGQIGNLIQRGKLMRKKAAYAESERYLKEALKKARQRGLRKYVLEGYREFKELKKEQGALAESLFYLESYVALRDSLYDTDKSKQIAALEFANDLEQKQREIQLLKEQERASNIIKYSLLCGILALGIIGFLVIRNQRQKRIQKQEVYEKKQELLQSKEALAQIALENAKLKEEEMERLLEFKNKELASFTLNFVQKNELFDQLKEKIESAKTAQPSQKDILLEELLRDIRKHVHIDKDWEDFKRFFSEVHTDFLKNLKQKHPGLSQNDLRICSLIRLNLSVKEMASVLGISPDSAKTARYRLRKKLKIDSEKELLNYFLEIENS